MGEVMLKRIVLIAALAATPLSLSEGTAFAESSSSRAASREHPRMPPVVPGVIVMGAIAAAMVRLNRRGPR
jgi:hypothetical protein